jgi:hypothetical protein
MRRHPLNRSSMTLSTALADILSPACDQCSEFAATCSAMCWEPKSGHVPRGFAGATGEPSEVELVLVVAEPGNPSDRETHTGLASAYDYANQAFEGGRHQFHRNILLILDMCWPEIPFDQKMRRVWITESVLCFASTEGGRISASVSRACGRGI